MGIQHVDRQNQFILTFVCPLLTLLLNIFYQKIEVFLGLVGLETGSIKSSIAMYHLLSLFTSM